MIMCVSKSLDLYCYCMYAICEYCVVMLCGQIGRVLTLLLVRTTQLVIIIGSGVTFRPGCGKIGSGVTFRPGCDKFESEGHVPSQWLPYCVDCLLAI